MNRLLKTAVLVLLLALVPFRGIAAATAGHCAAALAGSVQAHADLAESAAGHDDSAAGPHAHDKPGCSACAEHCSSMLVIVPADAMPFPAPVGTQRTAHGERLAAGFIPEHLDPPPLAG